MFAWNKLFRTDFWRGAGLSWPEGVRYEDQPTTTLAYLRARRFGVVPEVVYHWRIRSDGTSITQQRSSLEDLRDRWATKRPRCAASRSTARRRSPRSSGTGCSPATCTATSPRSPAADDEWWELLRTGVLSIWGARSLTHCGLLPADRLVGWLVEQGRRADAAAVVELRPRARPPVDRVETPEGRRLDLPADVLDVRTVAPEALSCGRTSADPSGPSAASRLLLASWRSAAPRAEHAVPRPGQPCSTGMGSPRTGSDVSSSGSRRASAPAGDQACGLPTPSTARNAVDPAQPLRRVNVGSG